MTKRFQFSLASLLIATAIAATAVNWWTLRRRAAAAKERFDEETSSFEAGTATAYEVSLASKELLQAELAIPFVPSDRRAWLSYLDRTRYLYRRARAHALNALFADDGWKQAHSFADKLLKECHDIEDRLGLPHVDEYPLPGMRIGRMDDNEDGDGHSADEIAPAAPGD